MLTHESQFAGCGKQRKQQNERTEQNSNPNKLFLMPDTFNKKCFQCRSHAPNLQAHSSRSPAEQDYRQYKVKLPGDVSLKRWPLPTCQSPTKWVECEWNVGERSVAQQSVFQWLNLILQFISKAIFIQNPSNEKCHLHQIIFTQMTIAMRQLEFAGRYVSKLKKQLIYIEEVIHIT